MKDHVWEEGDSGADRRCEIRRNSFLSEVFERDMFVLEINPHEWSGSSDEDRHNHKVLLPAELKKYPYVVCKHPLTDLAVIHALEDCGFRLMGLDAILTLPAMSRTDGGRPAVRTQLDRHVRRFRPEDEDKLQGLVYQSKGAFFSHTHFYNSPHLPKEACDRFYREWIMRDAGGRTALNYISSRGSKIDGFLMCHDRDREMEIDLIWVNPAVRRRGTGKDLIHAAIAEGGHDAVRVTTPLGNQGVLLFYQKLGFGIAHLNAAYHLATGGPLRQTREGFSSSDRTDGPEES